MASRIIMRPYLLNEMPSGSDSDDDNRLRNGSRYSAEPRNAIQQGIQNDQDIHNIDNNSHNNNGHDDNDEEIDVTTDDLNISNQVKAITRIADVPEGNVLLRGLIHYRDHIRSTEKYEQARLDAILEAVPTLEEFEIKKNIFLLIRLQSTPLGNLYIDFLQNKCRFRGIWVERVRRNKNAWKEEIRPFDTIPLPDVRSFEKYMANQQLE
jgi:hypothetical protein